jgi:hypothetical protein
VPTIRAARSLPYWSADVLSGKADRRFRKGIRAETSRRNSCWLRPISLIFSLISIAVLQFAGAGPSSADTVPYKDPSAVGSITLCDTTGHALTSGRTDFAPFAWRAVGSLAAKAPYNGTGRTATLYAYQPIQNVDPANWFGQNLTGSARYTDPGHPMVASTPADPTLASYLVAYPTKWGGLVQLRMFVGAPNNPTYFSTYNAATIKVTGDTWTMIQGGGGSCAAGTAVSDEMILPSVASMPTPHSYPSVAVPTGQSQSASSSQGSTSKSAKASGASGHSTSARQSAASSADSANPSVDGSPASNEAGSSGSSGMPLGLVVGIALVLLIVGGGGTWFWWRRRTVTGGQH